MDVDDKNVNMLQGSSNGKGESTQVISEDTFKEKSFLKQFVI